MKSLKRYLVKELLFYWCVASYIMLTITVMFHLSNDFKIMSILSIFLSKYLFDKYSYKYYIREISNDNT